MKLNIGYISYYIILDKMEQSKNTLIHSIQNLALAAITTGLLTALSMMSQTALAIVDSSDCGVGSSGSHEQIDCKTTVNPRFPFGLQQCCGFT